MPQKTPTPPPDPLAEILRCFSTQHGVAADRQVRAAKVSWERQQHLMSKGLWLRHAPGVLRDAASPTSWNQRAMAMTLMPGARPVIAAGSAGRLHQLDGCLDVNDITILVPDGARVDVPSGVRLLRTRRPTADDITTVDGIPVTSVALTLIHLQVHGPHPEQALDDALRRGERPDELRTVMERWRGPGVQGPPEMLALLHDRVDARLPRSWFQRLAGRLLAEEGLHFVDEWPVRDGRGRLLAELDLADVELKVGVECQSWERHGSPAAQRKDLARRRKLRVLGWDIVDLWWSDLDRMDDVVADIRTSVSRARAVIATNGPTA
ncbi:MAG: hypothetical protein JWM34_680 [Ilumatobacteraceae bacterium]|nr:hypothetical protein [Ilumatobacteraceae bacterium]